MVHIMKEAVWDLMQSGATEASILNLCRSGVRHWFAFLDELAGGQRTKSVTSLSQIDERLSAGDVAVAVASQRFVERHRHIADQPGNDGGPAPLRLNVSRLRQTFAQGMWVLSGGNLMRTSRLLGNLPSVTDSHYLDVTPEMQRNHKFVGTILHATITEKTQDLGFRSQLGQQLGMAPDQLDRLLNGEMNTGVGRCTDYLQGRYAPRNGRDVCTRFLHCFRCPNQVESLLLAAVPSKSYAIANAVSSRRLKTRRRWPSL